MAYIFIGYNLLKSFSGLEFVNQLIVDDDERAATIVAASNKWIYAPFSIHKLTHGWLYARYYALSAASALFKHSELRLGTRFAASSLLIRYAQVEGTMMIDSDTVRDLELVSNLSGRKNAHSLFG